MKGKNNTMDFSFYIMIINDNLILFLSIKLMQRHYEAPMLLFWMFLVLGLVSNVFALFLHANEIASLWVILANTYLR